MASNPRTNPERITAIEVEVYHLRNTVTDLLEVTKAQNEKLDSLLELKQKGMGAIWFASAILGSGLLGGIYFITSWLKGG